MHALGNSMSMNSSPPRHPLERYQDVIRANAERGNATIDTGNFTHIFPGMACSTVVGLHPRSLNTFRAHSSLSAPSPMWWSSKKLSPWYDAGDARETNESSDS